jgi:hypothetical protein
MLASPVLSPVTFVPPNYHLLSVNAPAFSLPPSTPFPLHLLPLDSAVRSSRRGLTLTTDTAVTASFAFLDARAARRCRHLLRARMSEMYEPARVDGTPTFLHPAVASAANANGSAAVLGGNGCAPASDGSGAGERGGGGSGGAAGDEEELEALLRHSSVPAAP